MSQLMFKSSTVENTVFIIKINKLNGSLAQTLGHYCVEILFASMEEHLNNFKVTLV